MLLASARSGYSSTHPISSNTVTAAIRVPYAARRVRPNTRLPRWNAESYRTRSSSSEPTSSEYSDRTSKQGRRSDVERRKRGVSSLGYGQHCREKRLTLALLWGWFVQCLRSGQPPSEDRIIGTAPLGYSTRDQALCQ